MKMTGDPGLIRTADKQFRKLLLYPSELRGHFYNRQFTKAADFLQPILTHGNKASSFSNSVYGRDEGGCVTIPTA
jgi:hypothetical protein